MTDPRATLADHSNRILAWLGLMALLLLPGCEGADRPSSTVRIATLPHALYVDDGAGRKFHLHLAPVVEGGRFTSGFGGRRQPLGGGDARHDGIDIAAPEGTPVRAAAGGGIVEIGRLGDYGRFIRIRHSDRLETAYAHLSRFAEGLKVGDAVRRDDVIGYVGSTGRSTSAHLHYEVRLNGKAVDPLGFARIEHGR